MGNGVDLKQKKRNVYVRFDKVGTDSLKFYYLCGNYVSFNSQALLYRHIKKAHIIN